MNRDEMWACKRQCLVVRGCDAAGIVIGKVVTIDDWTACVVGANPLGAVRSRWFDPSLLQAATAAECEVYEKYDEEERALETLGLRRGEVDQMRAQVSEQVEVIAELRNEAEPLVWSVIGDPEERQFRASSNGLTARILEGRTFRWNVGDELNPWRIMGRCDRLEDARASVTHAVTILRLSSLVSCEEADEFMRAARILGGEQ